ncbi:Putative enoyl-CoA hydratase/isomerase [Mycobacteroides abscessus subsp. massiliense]|nr:putative enoyl-CoA hydratase/isomerase [Mycobacteroides abscessus subsp. bolletii]SLH08877.1 Putative enoyl-CoA hydratase/isomerase [Mycobacteroides abscessus subsp. massiliense]
MSAARELLVERDGPVVVLTMNRPHRRNALSTNMVSQFAAAWDEIDHDDGIRAAILTGAGSAYCVGGDLSDGWMVRDCSAPPLDPATIGKGLLLSHTLTKPLIAAVNGACLGGGCEMLQQTDIRVSDEHATFGLPEVQRGLVPGAGSMVRLKRQIPYTKAMEMILTGEPLTAFEAYHFGLVGHVVPWQPELATDGRSWGRRFRRHARRRGWWCVDTRRRPAFGAPSRAPRHPCPGRGGVRPGVCPLSAHPASFDINNNDTSGAYEREGPTDTWREPACAAHRSRSPWRP